MSQVAPITVKDGQATPVTHVLNPLSSNPAKWRDTVGSLPSNGQVNLQMTRTAASKDLEKVRVVLSAPSLEATSGGDASGYVAAPKVAFECKFDITFFSPTRSTNAQRQALRGMLINLLADGQVVDVIDNGASPY